MNQEKEPFLKINHNFIVIVNKVYAMFYSLRGCYADKFNDKNDAY